MKNKTTTAFHQVVKMSHEEKVKMYMQVPVNDLINMLIHCNELMEQRPIVAYEPTITKSEYVSYLTGIKNRSALNKKINYITELISDADYLFNKSK